MSDRAVLTQDELDERTIRFSDWVPCKSAFIDCKTPGSELKDNYSFVGPGVTQNSSQHVNLRIPHGFQLGAAGMPNGVTNNLHLHFTAEVFVNLGGVYRLRWGPNGEQGTFDTHDGDVISVPTWIFRGFTNIGPDDGILYTVLGGDDTGGIIWGPQVLREAAGQGLYLTRANALVDTTLGEAAPAESELVSPLAEALLADLEVFSPEDFRSRVVTPLDRVYAAAPFLCSGLPGGGARLALVIGYGMTENRRQSPPIHEPHGFCAAWVSAEAGEGLLAHTIRQPQTLTVKSGDWKITLNDGPDQLEVTLGVRDTLSIPAGVVRRIQCLAAPADSSADLFVVTAGDERVRIEWHADVIRAAEEAGFALDPNGYVAPVAALASIGLR